MSNISISGCERACVKFGKKGVRLRRGMRLCAHDIKQLLWRESPIRRRGMFPRRTLATPDAQSQCRMRLSLRAHTHTTHLATTTTQNLAETSLPHQGLALILYSWMRSRFRMHSLRTIAWWLRWLVGADRGEKKKTIQVDALSAATRRKSQREEFNIGEIHKFIYVEWVSVLPSSVYFAFENTFHTWAGRADERMRMWMHYDIMSFYAVNIKYISYLWMTAFVTRQCAIQLASAQYCQRRRRQMLPAWKRTYVVDVIMHQLCWITFGIHTLHNSASSAKVPRGCSKIYWLLYVLYITSNLK